MIDYALVLKYQDQCYHGPHTTSITALSYFISVNGASILDQQDGVPQWLGLVALLFVIYASKPFSVLEYQRQTYMLTQITRLTWRVQSTETDVEKPIDNYRYQEPISCRYILIKSFLGQDSCFIIKRAPTETCVYNDNKDFSAIITEVYICRIYTTRQGYI